MTISSLEDLINSNNPLSRDGIKFLLDYREEDDRIDYKETLDIDSKKEWLEFTKDVMAFANTRGGYIVFGVKDSSFNFVGIDKPIANTLKNIDMLQQKVNRHVDPDILTIRAKEHKSEKKLFLIIFIPESKGKTHIVSKNGEFNYPGGRKKIVIREGTLYIRRSGGNHLVDSRDLDDIINRRINYYKKSLLDNITRVVEAPQDSNVFLLSKEVTTEDSNRYVIDDAPDAFKVKGMSFTVSPRSLEQEIAAWVSLFKNDSSSVPPPKILWKWYKDRKNINSSEKYRLYVGKFCLVSDVPVFYWIQRCHKDLIDKILNEAVDLISSRTRVEIIPSVSAFLSKTSYTKITKKIQSRFKNRLSRSMRVFPSAGPKSLFSPVIIESYRPSKRINDEEFKKELKERLDNIAESVVEQNLSQPDVMERRSAHAIDCYLYSQNDKYKT